jgi:hypothetical protein
MNLKIRSPKNNLLLLLLLCSFSLIAQVPEFMPKPETRITYLFYGVSIPLRSHFDPDAAVNNNRWMPDGLQTKFGFGLNYKRLLAAGVHVSTEWRISESLVAVPVFLNFRIAPEITDDLRIYIQPGYGAAFAIGRGSLSGDYKKISVGIEQDDALSVFAEWSQYGFSIDKTGHITALSLGIAVTVF